MKDNMMWNDPLVILPEENRKVLIVTCFTEEKEKSLDPQFYQAIWNGLRFEVILGKERIINSKNGRHHTSFNEVISDRTTDIKMFLTKKSVAGWQELIADCETLNRVRRISENKNIKISSAFSQVVDRIISQTDSKILEESNKKLEQLFFENK